MLMYRDKQSDFQEWQAAQQGTGTVRFVEQSTTQKTRPLVLSAYHQAPNLENIGQMLQSCASF